MVRTWMSSMLLGSLLLSGSAFAQVARDRAEKAQDRRELRQDANQRADDVGDLIQLRSIIQRYDRARAAGDGAGLVALEQELQRAIAGELSESRREMFQKDMEANRSVNEARQERREVGRDEARGRPGEARRDRRDLRDDRRDARDDMRDAGAERAQYQRRYNIAVELNGLIGRMDPASLERKRQLMQDLIREARLELREDRKETREDRRELREDRRETREDRRRR